MGPWKYGSQTDLEIYCIKHFLKLILKNYGAYPAEDLKQIGRLKEFKNLDWEGP